MPTHSDHVLGQPTDSLSDLRHAPVDANPHRFRSRSSRVLKIRPVGRLGGRCPLGVVEVSSLEALVEAPSFADGQVAACSFATLRRLYAAPTKYAASCVRSRPRYLVLRKPPTVFIQPNISSMRFRIRWLTR